MKRGVGAERTCDLSGGITIVERWTAWEEGTSFTYEGAGLPLVKRARNTWSVRAENANQTFFTTEADVELKGGWFGRALDPMMKWASRRMGSHSLAAFKYLVEHGEPFSRRHALLPRAPAAC